MSETKVPENKAYKVTLILLVGLAAFSTAVKDLNRLQEVVSNVQAFTTKLRGTDVVMLNADSISTVESCPDNRAHLVSPSDEFEASESVAPFRGMGDYGRIEPEVGGKVELVASTKATRGVPVTRVKNALARNLNEEISAKRRDGRWPARFEFKTFDHVVTLDLPITVTNIEASALEADGSPDFPLTLLRKISRKHAHVKTENGSREFTLKRFERSISSRRAS